MPSAQPRTRGSGKQEGMTQSRDKEARGADPEISQELKSQVRTLKQLGQCVQGCSGDTTTVNRWPISVEKWKLLRKKKQVETLEINPTVIEILQLIEMDLIWIADGRKKKKKQKILKLEPGLSALGDNNRHVIQAPGGEKRGGGSI